MRMIINTKHWRSSYDMRGLRGKPNHQQGSHPSVYLTASAISVMYPHQQMVIAKLISLIGLASHSGRANTHSLA